MVVKENKLTKKSAFAKASVSAKAPTFVLRASAGKPADKEKKSLRIEILEKIVALATTGFGLVAALAWNDAIKKLFSEIFPQPFGNTWALFIYAILITIIVVIITIHLGRLLNLVKKGEDDKNQK